MNENAQQWLEGALMDLRSIEKIMDDVYLIFILKPDIRENLV